MKNKKDEIEIYNPFLDYKNPEVQKKLQKWNKTCRKVAKDNDKFARKMKTIFGN
jgi:hypothetical protein